MKGTPKCYTGPPTDSLKRLKSGFLRALQFLDSPRELLNARERLREVGCS